MASIRPAEFFAAFQQAGVSFVVGVPDSLLKEFCAYVDAALPPEQHLIAANEGTAVGVAAGHQMASGRTPLVYLQNSGLGNTINPLLSLVDPEVYGIPVVMVVGWRGEPGVKDEPQHIKQGRVSPAMLDAMEIPYQVIEDDEALACASAAWAVRTAEERSGPVCLLVKQGVFGKSEAKRAAAAAPADFMAREAAIELATGLLPSHATVVSTTGHISRELYEQRVRKSQDRSSDFLTVGSMGHASQIALGIALAKPEKMVVCFDGDGAALMHMGGLATVAVKGPAHIKHIVFNNGVHGSVGGQPTIAFDISLTGIASACGYSTVLGPVSAEDEIATAVEKLIASDGPAFLEIRVAAGARSDLGRPKETPTENRAAFVKRLREGN